MSTQTAIVRLPLGRGLAQDQDARLVAPGSMGEAHNVVVDRAGRYRKRTGWGRLPEFDENDVQLDAPDRVDPVGAELLQVSQTDGRVWSWGSGRDRWEEIGWLPPFAVDRAPLVRTSSSLVSGGLATFGASQQYRLIAWQYGAGAGMFEAHAQTRDNVTGALIGRDGVNVYAGGPRATYPIVLSVGSSAWIVYAGGDVRARRHLSDLSTADTVISATSALIFDACAVDGGSKVLVAVASLVVGDVEVYLLNEDGTVADSVVLAAPAVVTELALCDGPGSEYHLAWTYGAGGARALELVRLDASLTAIGAPIAIESGVEDLEGPVLGVDHNGYTWLAWYGKLAASDVDGTHVRCVVAGALQAFRRQAWRYNAVAYPQRVGEGLYLPVGLRAAEGLTDAHLALVQLNDSLGDTPPRYAGLLVRQTAAASTLAQRWTLLDDGTYLLASIVKTREQPYGSDVHGIDLLTIDPEARPRLPAVTLPQQHVWASNGLWGYDSFDAHDINFLQPPELDQDPLDQYTQGGGGPYFADGTYIYRARYEFIDDRGVQHVSPWSNDYVFDTLGILDIAVVKIRIGTTQLTQHGRRGALRQITIALYRSKVNGVVDGVGQLFRLTPYGAGGVVAPLSQARVTYEDDENDAGAAGLGFITTGGGRLEARVPPPARAMTVHGGRVWLIGAEGKREAWYSQQILADETPTWNERLSLQLLDASEEPTGLASVEGQLLIYTPRATYYVSGAGPADTGTNGGFEGPYKVSSFGCIDPGSIVVTTRGAYARSAAGIVLHSRQNLEATVVSDPVRDLLDLAGAEIRHAVYHEAEALVVFHLWTDDGEVQRSTLLIYDERQGVWTTADSLELDRIAHLAYDREAQALAFAGQFSVFREGYGGANGYDGDPASPTWFGVVLSTPWLRAGEVAGWSQVKMAHLEGELCSPSTWVFGHRYDYNDAGAELTTPMALTGGRGDRVAKQIGPKYQTCAAVKFSLTEQAPVVLPDDQAAPGGVLWWGFALEVGLLPGLARLPATSRGGTSLWPNCSPSWALAPAPSQAACWAAPSALASVCR